MLAKVLSAVPCGQVLAKVRDLEERGYFLGLAEASIDLMIRRTLPGYTPPFETLDYHVTVSATIPAVASSFDTSHASPWQEGRPAAAHVPRLSLRGRCRRCGTTSLASTVAPAWHARPSRSRSGRSLSTGTW